MGVGVPSITVGELEYMSNLLGTGRLTATITHNVYYVKLWKCSDIQVILGVPLSTRFPRTRIRCPEVQTAIESAPTLPAGVRQAPNTSRSARTLGRLCRLFSQTKLVGGAVRLAERRHPNGVAAFFVRLFYPERTVSANRLSAVEQQAGVGKPGNCRWVSPILRFSQMSLASVFLVPAPSRNA